MLDGLLAAGNGITINPPEHQMVNCLMHLKSSGSTMQMIPNPYDQVLTCNKVNVLVRSDPLQVHD